MEDFQKRMADEFVELAGRLKAAIVFLHSPAVEKLDGEAVRLLSEQVVYMDGYARTLKARLEHMGLKVEIVPETMN